jgi:hypothetical protein
LIRLIFFRPPHHAGSAGRARGFRWFRRRGRPAPLRERRSIRASDSTAATRCHAIGRTEGRGQGQQLETRPASFVRCGAPRRGFDSSRARRQALRGGQIEDPSNDDLEGSTACRLRCGRHPRRRRSSRSFFAMRISRRRSSITTSTTTRSACSMLARRWRHCPPLEYVNPSCALPAPTRGGWSQSNPPRRCASPAGGNGLAAGRPPLTSAACPSSPSKGCRGTQAWRQRAGSSRLCRSRVGPHQP